MTLLRMFWGKTISKSGCPIIFANPSLWDDPDHAQKVTTMLSGEYDEREAEVHIRSGAGGVDVADWAEMLVRMYTRWAEKHGHKVDVYDISHAEEASVKSATFVVHGGLHVRAALR